jgi:TonB-linked SusC/RagA family outer membrane protein
MKRVLHVFLFILFFSQWIFSQERTVTGTVTSAEDEKSLPGVSVYVKGTTTGTVTDIDGFYKLAGVNAGSVLVFSFVGYDQQEITAGEKKMINVRMLVSTKEIEGVVVTALGIKRQEREIGYTAEKIDVEAITRSGAQNLVSAISGRAPGVQISQADGVEGGSTRIIIRGNNNISANNQPLFVVDGIPMENIPGLTDVGRGVDWGSAINDLNMYDMENMTVLYGGKATALYGSRGANGVVYLTSKRGTRQNGIGVNYNLEYKITTPYRFREVQDVYGAGGPISFTPPTFPLDTLNGDTVLGYPGIYETQNLIIDTTGATSSSIGEFGYYGGGVSWGPEMGGQMVKWWDGTMRAYSPYPDYQQIPYHDGYTVTHNISASGGGERGTMRVSLTRQDHSPIIDNSDFNRTTINTGVNLKVSDKVKADLVFSYVNFHRLNSPIIGEDANSFNKGLLYSWPTSYQGEDKEYYELPDGSRNPMDNYPYNYVDKFLWWNYYKNNTTLIRDKYLGILTLTYDVTSWLNIMGKAGRDYTIDQYETKREPTDVIGLENGYYSNSLFRNVGDNFDLMLMATKESFLRSKFDLMFAAGTSRWNHNIYGISGHSGTWYYPNMYTFFNLTENSYYTDENGNTVLQSAGNSASSVVPQESFWRERINSVYSFFNISYNKYLFIELTGRNDWSSTLPPGENSYFYPSASLSFIASEAFRFSERLPWFNFLKLRGGAALTATDTDPYVKDFYYTTGLFGGEQTSGLPGTIPPFLLKPQGVNAYEGGINMGFFENRIDFYFTYYYNYSFDQILSDLPVPVSSGAPTITINEGELTNQGFEIKLNTVPLQKKNFLITSGINFARNRNKVISLGNYADVFPLADIWGLNGPAMALHEGDEYGTIYGYDYVYDANGNRIVNDAGTKYLVTDNRVPVGNASPDFIAGWSTDFKYKNLRLSFLVDTKWGGDIYCGSYVIALQTGQSPETLIEREGGGLPYTDPDGNTSNIGVILEGVHEDGTPNTTVVHYYYKYLPNAGGWGHFLSTPGIIENTWVKMREISLSFILPQKWINKSKVFQNLSLNITGRDLFYFYTTLPDKINPEGIMGAGNAQGFEWASYPGTRSFVFGINASF